MEDVIDEEEYAEGAPEQPEILSIYREMKLLGAPYIAGPIILWPHIFRLEMKVCAEAEQEYRARVNANIRRKLEHLKNAG